MESVSAPDGGENGAAGVEVWVGIWAGAGCGRGGERETGGICGLGDGMAGGYDRGGFANGLMGVERRHAYWTVEDNAIDTHDWTRDSLVWEGLEAEPKSEITKL